MAVADAVPFVAAPVPGEVGPGRTILVEGPKFVVERWQGGDRVVALPEGVTGWLVPVRGQGTVDGIAWHAGQCLTVRGEVMLDAAPGSDVLFAYPGAKRL